jgi:hypothetical protein
MAEGLQGVLRLQKFELSAHLVEHIRSSYACAFQSALSRVSESSLVVSAIGFAFMLLA